MSSEITRATMNLPKNKLTNEELRDKILKDYLITTVTQSFVIDKPPKVIEFKNIVNIPIDDLMNLIHQAEIKARIDEISRWFDLPRHYKGEEYRDEPFVKVKCKTPKMTRYQLLDINFTWAVLDRISALEKEIINE